LNVQNTGKLAWKVLAGVRRYGKEEKMRENRTRKRQK
jgi:hypothetical protein